MVRTKQAPLLILRELQRQEAFNTRGIYPTLTQIQSKKKYMFMTQCMDKARRMEDTADLRNYIEEMSVVPEDPHQT